MMKKAIRIVLFSFLGLLLGGLVYTAIVFGPLVRGAKSVVKLDEGLYYMEYKGDDGFDRFMEKGGGRNAAEIAAYVMDFLSKGFYHPQAPSPEPAGYGCSSITARTPQNDVLMGRNFDFNKGTGMILHSIPKRGYESITTFNVDYYGFGEDWLPEGFMNQYLSLTGLFFALDGVNEKGLAVADLMAGDDAVTNQDTGKPSLTTTSAIRYMLNKAATVDEALNLLRGIDMHSDIGAAHHYAISDASGRSVVVEYVDDRLVAVDSPIAANHYLCAEKCNVGLIDGDIRYEWLCRQYEACGGVMQEATFQKVIAAVSQPEQENWLGTAWTMVMNLTHPSVTYYSRRHFDQPFHFELEREKWADFL